MDISDVLDSLNQGKISVSKAKKLLELYSIEEVENFAKIDINRKMRKGKSVTLIEGFVGSADDLKELAKSIKTACGVGGTSKNGEIMIQGEFKDKVVDLLFKLGYNSVKKGGY